MSYPVEIKEKAIRFRKKGYSIKEVAKKINISVATSSMWLSEIGLSRQAQIRLKKRSILGQYKARKTAKKKKATIKKELSKSAYKALSNIEFNQELNKLLCSIFFWTEGGKFTDGYVYFMNSDPVMIATFMKLLRSSFQLDEKKLRALVHLHDYHNKEEIERFWSDLIQIPLSQFSKSYLKTNTKKRIRPGYQGCIRIRYYDSKIALELRSIYNAFAQYLGVSVNW